MAFLALKIKKIYGWDLQILSSPCMKSTYNAHLLNEKIFWCTKLHFLAHEFMKFFFQKFEFLFKYMHDFYRILPTYLHATYIHRCFLLYYSYYLLNIQYLYFGILSQLVFPYKIHTNIPIYKCWQFDEYIFKSHPNDN